MIGILLEMAEEWSNVKEGFCVTVDIPGVVAVPECVWVTTVVTKVGAGDVVVPLDVSPPSSMMTRK